MNRSAGDEAAGWPFLVSRGRRLGYRVVVAPDFLCAAGDAGVLFEAAQTGPGVSTDGPQLRVVEASSGEPLSLVYRMTTARNDEHGGADGPLRDGHGRPIPMFEGYVVRGRYQHISITDEEWTRAHEKVVAGLGQLLADEDADAGEKIVSSDALPLSGADGQAGQDDSPANRDEQSKSLLPSIFPFGTLALLVILSVALVLVLVLST